MELRIYAVHDAAVAAYLTPFFCRTAAEAIRSFEAAVNAPDTRFNQAPADYTLFEIGTYEDNSGILTPHKTHQPLGKAIDFIQRAPQLAAVADNEEN